MFFSFKEGGFHEGDLPPIVNCLMKHPGATKKAPRTVAACTRIAGVALLATRLPRSEPGVRMPICWFPTRAAAFLVPRQIQHPLCLTVLLAGLFTCQSIRTSSTLHAPTHYTRNRPCVLDTPQKNTVMAPTACQCIHASCRLGCRNPQKSCQNPRALQAEVHPHGVHPLTRISLGC